MTDEIKNREESSPNGATTVETRSPKVSACGCDTDHNNGIYVTTTYRSKRIYFCEESCRVEFLQDPEAFLKSDHFTLDFEVLENN